MTKLTVKDLFERKGRVKLTELYVTNALEAYAAEKSGNRYPNCIIQKRNS